MQRHGVRRLAVTSMVGEGDSAANTPFYLKIAIATFLRGAAPDKAKMESIVSGSELDWVITRPAILTEKPATGDVRIFSADNRDKAHSITRSDLAAFLVAQLTSDDHLRQAVTIANRLSPSRSTPGQKRAAELRGASGISNRTPRTPGQSRHLIGAAPRTGV